MSPRLPRSLRAAVRRGPAPASVPPAPAEERVDSWLEAFHGERLTELDAACAAATGPERFALFRGLDDDLWALLLTQQYELYPAIRALLPAMPEVALQEVWNGRSGVALAAQSRAFYAKLRAAYERERPGPLAAATVLDFGCGWGRLTRLLARDVAPGRLFACDPVEGILDACRAARVPATLARSEFRPQRVPFAERFDLAFAFSVFTHLSERAHEACLGALHQCLLPGGLLIVTIRPPAFLERSPAMAALRATLGPDLDAALAEPRYLYVPHPVEGLHPQYSGEGEMDYGDTLVTMAYIRERWLDRFALVGAELILEDPEQVMLTLRRR